MPIEPQRSRRAAFASLAPDPDLLQTLADCPKARSASIHDRCKVVYEGLVAG